MADDSSFQRISRLTPLDAVLGLIARRVMPVDVERCARRCSGGYVLGQDVVAAPLPSVPIALRDGYAVEAAMIADAGAYAPLPFPVAPERIDAGGPLPAGADAVAPLDAVVFRGPRAEAIAAVTPGEGVLAAAADAAADTVLRRAGDVMRCIDKAVLAPAGIESVSSRRPRICVARGEAADSAQPRAALDALFDLIVAAGGRTTDQPGREMPLSDALGTCEFDALIGVGGTGSGRRDASVLTLARRGRVEVHGVAIAPGETTAFGFATAAPPDAFGEKPVLILPDRVDAALTAWLLIGRPLLARLTGGGVNDRPVLWPLRRKVASTIGIVELIPVACADGAAEPLASGYLPLSALARSDGWILVPAASEGFAAGTPVAVRPWP